MKSLIKIGTCGILLASLGSFPGLLLAWGERGHQVVTRAAVRLVEVQIGHQAAEADFVQLLKSKEHMLAHLSNVPDIVWRGMEPNIAQQNAPTHFLDMEFLLKGVSRVGLQDLPKTTADYRDAIEKTCLLKPEDCAPGDLLHDKIGKTGHAPFRAEQLLLGMEDAFRKLRDLQDSGAINRGQASALINEALIYAGLASHFIGDLGNPHHTTKNYDGQLTGQRGFHSYFETRIVSSYELGLSSYVFRYASKDKPFQRLVKQHQPKDRLEKIWALTLNSFQQLDRLFRLDERYSLIRRGDSILLAERHPPIAVNQYFKAIAVERMATAADTLADLWVDAWTKSGRPSLAGYQSYDYPLQPEFIAVEYLDMPKQNVGPDESASGKAAKDVEKMD